MHCTGYGNTSERVEKEWKNLGFYRKRLDEGVCFVLKLTGDMEVRSFFYARNHDGYMILHGCENVDLPRSIMEKGPCK